MNRFLKLVIKSCMIISFFVTSFLLISCEENLNLMLSTHDQMITVNCILNAGDTVKMEVNSSQAYPPMIDSSLTIKDATVKLFEDHIYIEDLVYKEVVNKEPLRLSYQKRFCFYQSPTGFVPKAGHTYSVSISAPGFTDVYAETVIPQPVQIISVDTNSVFTKYDNSVVRALECIIKFKDPTLSGDSYNLIINRAGRYKACSYGGYPCTTFTIPYIVPFFCYDPNAVYFRLSPGSPGSIPLEKEDNDHLLSNVYMTDDTFNNETYSLRVLITRMGLFDYADPPAGEKFTFRKLNFSLYSVNKEYYKYASSYFTQIYKKNDMFSEPVQVYSNIVNGTGIFSSSSVSIDSSIVVPVYYAVFFDK
jgi:hypothetical protein